MVTYPPRASPWSVLLVLSIIALIGCSRIVTGGYVDSADRKYRVYGKCYGAYGRDYTGSSSKTVRITIVANDEYETQLFRSEYRVRGADVGWDAAWDHGNNLIITIYNYGAGRASHAVTNEERAKRVVRKLSFRLNSKTGTFAEQRLK